MFLQVSATFCHKLGNSCQNEQSSYNFSHQINVTIKFLVTKSQSKTFHIFQVSATHSHQPDCQRCILNTLSNRTMSLDCNELINRERFISQRQYKRKLKRDCPSYATMDRSKKRSLEEDTENPKLKMVSKTTFKLRYHLIQTRGAHFQNNFIRFGWVMTILNNYS